MNQLLKLLSRIVVIMAIVNITYLEPKVFALQPIADHTPVTNNNTMNNKHYENLDIVTINFLNAIEESSSLYDSKNFSTMQEIIVRIRLQDAFQEYFSVLHTLESRGGLEMTERSREVVQETIAEFMESDNTYSLTKDLTRDLDGYSRVLTESMIYSAVAH